MIQKCVNVLFISAKHGELSQRSLDQVILSSPLKIQQLELFETVKRSYGKIWLLKMRFCGYYTLCPIYQIFEAACIQEKRRQGVTYFQTLYLISIYKIPCIKSDVGEHDMNYLQHGESYIYKGISASLIHIDQTCKYHHQLLCKIRHNITYKSTFLMSFMASVGS